MNTYPHGDDRAAVPILRLGVVALFYGSLAALGALWRWLARGDGPWLAPGGGAAGCVAGTLAGLLTGGALVVVSREWTRSSRSGRVLRERFAPLVAGRAPAPLWGLALASGLGEEVFFRGALQPQVGWVAASLLFGLAHLSPGPGRLAWPLFATIGGLAFGALYEQTGTLLAPVVAHVLVNGLNLSWLARFPAERAAGPS